MKTSNNKKVLVNKGHLTSQERDKLTILYSKGLSIRNIANILAFKSTKRSFSWG